MPTRRLGVTKSGTVLMFGDIVTWCAMMKSAEIETPTGANIRICFQSASISQSLRLSRHHELTR